MIEEKLNSLGVKLSDTQSTVGSFLPVVITGNLAFVSGQIPIEPGSNPVRVNYKGKVGREISLEDGRAAARVCIINGLSELQTARSQSLIYYAWENRIGATIGNFYTR